MVGSTGARGGGGLMRAPETDVVETEREIRVQTEMPGLTRDNIDIDVENNVLTIRGEKQEQRTEGEEGKFHIAERRCGTFTRSFVLPPDVDAEQIQAGFENGVLTVTIPKSEKARRRRIEIGGSSSGEGRSMSVGQGGGPQQTGGGSSGRQTGSRERMAASGGESGGGEPNR